MSFSTQASSNSRVCVNMISMLKAIIFLGHIADALQSTTTENGPLSLITSLKNRNLKKVDVYNVNTNFKLQLDYVPRLMNLREEDRLTLLLEECLLDNIPPFQEKVNSAQYVLENTKVVLGEQRAIAEIASVGFRSQNAAEYEPYKEANEETFRLIVDVSVEGEYRISEETDDSDHLKMPPTNKDFDYALLRFFDVDEGGYTFLDSYITNPESSLPYFEHLKRIHAARDNNIAHSTSEDPTSEPRSHPSERNIHIPRPPLPHNPLLLFAIGMLVCVAFALNCARRYYMRRDRNGFSLFTASEKECGSQSSTDESGDDSSTETIIYSVEGEESEEAVKYRCAPPPEILPTGDVDIDATYEMSKILANGYQMIT